MGIPQNVSQEEKCPEHNVFCEEIKKIFIASRKHAYIILTPLNPTFV